MFGPHQKSPSAPSTRVTRQKQTTLDGHTHPKSRAALNDDDETEPAVSSSNKGKEKCIKVTRREPHTESDGSQQEADESSVADAVSGLKINTVDEGRLFLEDIEMVSLKDDNSLGTLVDTLGCIALFPGLPATVINAICSVALLLAQSQEKAATSRGSMVERALVKLTGNVMSVTQAAIAEIKAASLAITELSTQIAATTSTYPDALKSSTANPVASAAMLDARVRAREGIRVRQVLVDALATGQQLHQGVSNASLVESANKALDKMEDLPKHRFVGAKWLTNSGLLLEMDSEVVAQWISIPFNKAAFLGRFAPEATLKARSFALVVQFMPLHFNLCKEAEI